MKTLAALLALCEGNPPINSGFPPKGLVMQSFDVFFDVSLNTLLNKWSSGQWFEMHQCSCDVTIITAKYSEFSVMIIHIYIETLSFIIKL